MKRTEWKSEEERLRWTNNAPGEAAKLAALAMVGGIVIGFLLAWWLL